MNLDNQSVQQHSEDSKHDEFKRREEARIRINDLLRRAYAAYYSFASEPQKWPHAMKHRETHPDPSYSFINEVENREYVILANMKGPLAVYQVQKRDLLKRLESYDPEILQRYLLDFSKLD